MNRRRGPRSIVGLLILIALAFAYSVVEQERNTLVGRSSIDGIAGVLLGLFICAQPAANFLSLLYRSSGERHEGSVGWLWWVWPLLNGLTLFAGVSVIFIGALQFTRATALR